ncbi:MAG: ABC transporter substrate-binding protein [Acidimicrobiales bacterium]
MTRRPTRRSLIAATALAVVTSVSAASAGAATRSARPLLDTTQCTANRAVGPITYASPFGFDASAGILDVFVAQRLGYFANLCLTVNVVTNATDVNELVSSGRAQFTNEGSAADTLEAIAGGANLVGVDTSGDTSDYAVITGPSITSLRQLDGRTLGYYNVLPVVIREMLVRAGATISRVHLVADTNYDPTQVLQGTVQGLQAYQSNQVITLRALHARFREFTPQQFSIPGTYNVMVANAAFLHRHRVAVADFMRADLHALHYCLAHPAACVAIEGADARAAGVPFSTSHENAVWSLERRLTLASTPVGRGIGVQTYAEWRPEAAALRHFGVLARVPALARAEDVSLVAGLYRGTTLVWP